MSRPALAVRITRRQLTLRVSSILLAAVVMSVGLWGATHIDDAPVTAPIQATAAVFVEALPGTTAEAPATEVAVDDASAVGVIACILGLLCGLALATLLFFASRPHLIRLRGLRPPHEPAFSDSEFGHRGRRSFGLADLSLLRI